MVLGESSQTILPEAIGILGGIDPPPGIPDDTSDVVTMISTIITVVYALAGVVAVAFIIMAGYSIITSSGDPNKLKKGTDTLVWAVAGLVLVVCSSILFEFIANLLGVEDLIMFLDLPWK